MTPAKQGEGGIAGGRAVMKISLWDIWFCVGKKIDAMVMHCGETNLEVWLKGHLRHDIKWSGDGTLFRCKRKLKKNFAMRTDFRTRDTTNVYIRQWNKRFINFDMADNSLYVSSLIRFMAAPVFRKALRGLETHWTIVVIPYDGVE